MVVESWMPSDDDDRKGMDSEPVLPAEINDVAVMRDAVTVITAALLPSVMFMRPLARAMLLPNHALFVAWLYMPRPFLDMPNRGFVAWLHMPGNLLGVFNALGPMLLPGTFPLTYRRFRGMVLSPVLLSACGLVFVFGRPVFFISMLAVCGNRSTEK